jgi:hypothetical protein
MGVFKYDKDEMIHSGKNKLAEDKAFYQCGNTFS